jgi:uncharacterized protein (DUF58 family)
MTLGPWVRGVLSAWVRVCPLAPSGEARVLRRAVYILPTRAGLVFGGILLLMLVGSLNYQNNLGLLFTFLTTAIVLVSMHYTWLNLLGLAVTARAGPPVFAGDRAVFDLLITTISTRRRPDLRLAAEGLTTIALDLEPGGTPNARLTLPTQGRGPRPLGRLTLETRYPLGVFRSWCYLETAAVVMVYPRPADRAPPPHTDSAGSEWTCGVQDPGADDFAGLRGYRPGDSPRQLDWKAYGRGRGLLVKQFGRDRGEQLWLAWELLPPADNEVRLSWLCRQVLDASQKDRDFGLCLPGREIWLGRGEAQMHRCLAALALFGPGGATTTQETPKGERAGSVLAGTSPQGPRSTGRPPLPTPAR